MGFPVKVCKYCQEEFELKPDHKGFANICHKCSRMGSVDHAEVGTSEAESARRIKKIREQAHQRALIAERQRELREPATARTVAILIGLVSIAAIIGGLVILIEIANSSLSRDNFVLGFYGVVFLAAGLFGFKVAVLVAVDLLRFYMRRLFSKKN